MLQADTGFDTSIAGTPESSWQTLQLRAWAPEPGPLLVLAPHPDDETLGAGGLIHSWAQRQLPVSVVCVTDGEAACPEVPDLADVRRWELTRALEALAPHGGVEVVRLQLPDGQVRLAADQLATALSLLVSAYTTIVAPFEHDGHPDHDCVGRVARAVAHQHKLAVAQYPIWAWHRGAPQLFADYELGRFALSRTSQAAKQVAIRSYASQLGERPGGAIVPPHVLTYFDRPYEVFVL